MNREQFNTFLRNKVNENVDSYDELNTGSKGLTFWFLTEIFNLLDNDAIDSIVDGGNDKGIDAIYIDERSNDIYVFQTKFKDDYNRNLAETDLILTFNGMRWLHRGDLDNVNALLKSKGEEYREYFHAYFPKVKIIFIHTCNEPVNTDEEVLFLNEFNELEQTFSIEYYSFIKLFESYKTKLLRPPSNEAIMNLIGNPYKYDKTGIRTLIAAIKARELAELQRQYGYSIYTENVRSYLGEIKVNKGIYETASSNDESQNFWFYNNGVTITCDEFSFRETGDSTVKLTNFQIVNGCQTVNSLYKSLTNEKLSDEAELLIKIIEKPDPEFVNKITLFTNSQSAIRESDFISKDPLQLQMHNDILKMDYFYEHKRGLFNTMFPTLAQKREKFGVGFTQKIVKIDVASQVINSFYIHEPAKSKAKKQLLLISRSNGGYYEDVFGIIRHAEEILFSYKLYNKIKVKKMNLKREIGSSEPDSEIVKYEWILHADFFILTLFNYLYFDETKLNDLEYLSFYFDSIDHSFDSCWDLIIDVVTRKIEEKRTDRRYSHHKYFKSESAIGELKSLFSERRVLTN